MSTGDYTEPAGSLSPLTSVTAEALPRAVPSYVAERIDGAAAVLVRIAEHENACTALAFQRSAWLKPLYESLAADVGATALAICVTDAASGELAVLLPLVITRDGPLSIVSWASLGVSDYGAPLLGAWSPATELDAQAMWASIKRCLQGCDLVQLSNMPRYISGRLNPFSLLKAKQASRHASHTLTLDTTVEAFLASRGKKYRKEAERCTRLLQEKGSAEFRRAQSDADISEAYAALQAQQQERHAALGSDYRLDQPAYARFFEVALRSGTPAGATHIFTLRAGGDGRAGGDIGAVLYGISHGSTFTLLRISTAGEAWRRVSPGRLIVLDTMRYFLGQGVTTFDMGIGDYAFKHGFGTNAGLLDDVVAPLSLKGAPKAAITRAKAKARQYPVLVHAAKRVFGRS
jgi:CelD/BcsL family acetyltransferase involved in cellulose biosynthesis